MYRAILRTSSSGEAFRVLMAICSWADSEGWCHASLAKIARRAKVEDRGNVHRCIKALQAAGEVEIFPRSHQRDPIKDRRTPSGGWQPTNLYRVVYVDTLRQAEPAGKVLSPRQHLNDPQGVVTTTTKVLSKRPSTHLLYKSEIKSGENGVVGSLPSPAEYIRLYGNVVHGILDEDPQLGGTELLHALENWARRRHGMTTDPEILGAAIEQALTDRKLRATTPERKAESA